MFFHLGPSSASHTPHRSVRPYPWSQWLPASRAMHRCCSTRPRRQYNLVISSVRSPCSVAQIIFGSHSDPRSSQGEEESLFLWAGNLTICMTRYTKMIGPMIELINRATPCAYLIQATGNYGSSKNAFTGMTMDWVPTKSTPCS